MSDKRPLQKLLKQYLSEKKAGQRSNLMHAGAFLVVSAVCPAKDNLLFPKMRPVGVTKKGKKDRNFHASNWVFAQTTHVDVAPWNFAVGYVMRALTSFTYTVMAGACPIDIIKSAAGSSSCGESKIGLSH